ncbi:MAG: beta-ketoacyl-ACP synthase III [Candidatus Eisenbacteria bacterium]
MIRSRITGIGFHVPPRVVTNHDLEQIMDTSDAWIVERTGIRERRFVEGDVGSSELGIEAAKKALADAGRSPADVDFVIFATTTADWMFPGNGVIVQEKLGLGTVGALDVRNACSGFVYSLSVADAFVRMGQYKCVLVIGAEVQSTGVDLRTEGRDMAVLFGDGAGAAVVEPCTDGNGILSWALHSEGQFARELWCEAPSSRVPGRVTQQMLDEGRQLPRMNGRQVFKNATTRFPEVIHEVLEKAGHTLDEVALVVPHQANQRIGDAVVAKLGVPPEKVFQNVQRYGNTTAASIPIALTEARDAGLVKRGDLIVLAAFGAGFAWAGACLRW